MAALVFQGSAEFCSFPLRETVRDHGLGWPTGLCQDLERGASSEGSFVASAALIVLLELPKC